MVGDGPSWEVDAPEPRGLRILRWLVSTLLVVMICAMLAIATVIVTALASGPPGFAGMAIEADAVRLPAGERVVAVGRGSGEVLAVTEDAAGVERIRAFDAETGAQRSVTRIDRD
ncbi:MAG: DUF6476 family protein [Paracoccaceae bacterium]